MAKLLRQKGRGRGEVRLGWGISSWLKAFVFPHPRHIKHLTTCRRLIDFTALLQTSCRSSAPRSSLTHPATIFEQAQPSNPVLPPVLGTVRFGCRPFCSCKLHSNYTILIRGTFKSFQFQVVPLFKCVALPFPPSPGTPARPVSGFCCQKLLAEVVRSTKCACEENDNNLGGTAKS